jgi:hypothetical protein
VRFALWIFVLVALVVPVVALADPPSNDDRASAREITFPGSVTGTLVEATVEDEGEPFSCESAEGSVWYRFDAADDGRVALRLIAFGDLDASLELYRRVRSQLNLVTCQRTDAKGEADLGVRVEKGGSYFVRVARRRGSVEDSFLLESFLPAPPATPPGPRLPERGVSGMLDRLGNDDDAWAVRMRPGTSYRINLSHRLEGCPNVALFPPGTRSFSEDEPVRRLGCGGYTLYTPGPDDGGVHSILVQAIPWLRGPQRYRLDAAPAGVDDTVPGRRLDRARRGTIGSERIDVRDLYRFDVVRRSDVRISLGTGGRIDLVLLGEGGKRLACACDERGPLEISLRLKRGRYYASVEAQPRGGGRYVLRKLARIITRTRASVEGRRRLTIRPGRSVTLAFHVGPDATGPLTVTVERRDPRFGWQFLRRFRTKAVDGRARVPFSPPSLGRYRIAAEFEGTGRFAPSESRFARLRVVEPIRR